MLSAAGTRALPAALAAIVLLIAAPAFADPTPTPTPAEGKLSIEVATTDSSAKAGTPVAVTATLTATGGTVSKARIAGTRVTGGSVSGQCRRGCALGDLTDPQTIAFVVSAPSNLARSKVVTLKVAAASPNETVSDSVSVTFVPKVVQLPGGAAPPPPAQTPVDPPPRSAPKAPLPNASPQALPFQKLPNAQPQISPGQAPQIAPPPQSTARLSAAADSTVDAFGLIASALSAWLAVLLGLVVVSACRVHHARRAVKPLGAVLDRGPAPSAAPRRIRRPTAGRAAAAPKPKRARPRSFLGFSVRMR